MEALRAHGASELLPASCDLTDIVASRTLLHVPLKPHSRLNFITEELWNEAAEASIAAQFAISPPSVSKKSRKRGWTSAKSSKEHQNVRSTIDYTLPLSPPPKRSPPPPPLQLLQLPRAEIQTPEKPASLCQAISADHVSARPTSRQFMKQAATLVSADAGEAVVLRVLENVQGLRDLFAAARINRGFYRVFKRHELRLMKRALKNLSPAAWELREASPKEILAAMEGPLSEYTPTRYNQFHRRDQYTLTALKSLILVRCQSYLRPESIETLANGKGVRARELDDAFWRIWTFCTMFGSDSGKEEDVYAQMDWLNGGAIAHEVRSIRECERTSTLTDDSVLLSASSAFGRGNRGGLTAEELYDMTEIWNCMQALLHGIVGQGRLEQARSNGVFQGQGLVDGDGVAEVELLGRLSAPSVKPKKIADQSTEEWVHYLATLGPSAILDLAPAAACKTDSVFATAQDMQWTRWRRPRDDASRSMFLREPVTRIYQERLDAARMIAKIREASATRTAPMQSAAVPLQEHNHSVDAPATTSSERPMSLWVQWMKHSETGIAARSLEGLPAAGSSAGKEMSGAADRAIRMEDRTKARGRSRSSSTTFSLFPPQYSRSTTPVASTTHTPARSRATSLQRVASRSFSQSSPALPKI